MNSGLFRHTVYYLSGLTGSAFAFFEALDAFYAQHAPAGEAGIPALARILFDFGLSFADAAILRDVMRFDILKCGGKLPLPDYLTDPESPVAPHTPGRKSRAAHFSISLDALERDGAIVPAKEAWLFDPLTGARTRL